MLLSKRFVLVRSLTAQRRTNMNPAGAPAGGGGGRGGRGPAQPVPVQASEGAVTDGFFFAPRKAQPGAEQTHRGGTRKIRAGTSRCNAGGRSPWTTRAAGDAGGGLAKGKSDCRPPSAGRPSAWLVQGCTIAEPAGFASVGGTPSRHAPTSGPCADCAATASVVRRSPTRAVDRAGKVSVLDRAPDRRAHLRERASRGPGRSASLGPACKRRRMPD